MRNWIAGNGGGLPPMQVEGKGEREPVAPNSTDGRDNPDGRAKNRRVALVIENR